MNSGGDPATFSGRFSEWGLFAASLVVCFSLGRLMMGGFHGAVEVSVVGLAVIGFVIPAVLSRTRVPGALTAMVTTAAVVFASTLVAAPRRSGSFVPEGGRLFSVWSHLRTLHGDLSPFHPPFPATHVVIFAAGMVAGMAAMTGRLLLGRTKLGYRRERPAIALLPSLAVVVATCAALAGSGAGEVAGIWCGAAVLSVANWGSVGWRHSGASRGSWRGTLRRAWPAMLLGALVVAAPIGFGTQLGALANPTTGAGSSGSSGSGVGRSTAITSELSLRTGFSSVARDDPHAVLFTARTPVITYWQVAVLTTWKDDAWVPGPATDRFLSGAAVRVPRPTISVPTPGTVPTGVTPYGVTVTIGGLSGRLLPVPLSTTSVEGLGSHEVSGVGAVAARTPDPYSSYSAKALFSTSLGGHLGGDATTNARTLAPDRSVPHVPADIAALARQVTKGAGTQLAQAESLVNWFQSGLFHYTLTPPVPPRGTSSLVAFLTLDHKGSCESFASAFTVMARTLGLSSRVAVGFTSGEEVGTGETVVEGLDAHAWPEVYLATSGWVSFEPTPALPGGQVLPTNVIGPTQLITPFPTRIAPGPLPTGNTVPITTAPPPTTQVISPTTSQRSGRTVPPVVHAAGQGHSSDTVGTLVAVTVSVLLILAALVELYGRLRARRRRAGAPNGRVLAAHRDLAHILAVVGCGRAEQETSTQHLRNLYEAATSRPWIDDPASSDALIAALTDALRVATMAEEITFGTASVSSEDARSAEEAAQRAGRTLRRRVVRRRLESIPSNARNKPRAQTLSSSGHARVPPR